MAGTGSVKSVKIKPSSVYLKVVLITIWANKCTFSLRVFPSNCLQLFGAQWDVVR